MFNVRSESSAAECSPIPREGATDSRIVDIAGMVRQASTSVKVHQLLRSGKKEILLLSRDKIDDLIRRAVRNIFEKTRQGGAAVAPSLLKRMEVESRKEFDDLRDQRESTIKADADLVQSRLALDTELQDMRDDLAQQRAFTDGMLPPEVERVMVEKRFEVLYAHLCAMDRALGTLFSSKIYSYRQLQTLLRQAAVAQKAIALKARGRSLSRSLPLKENAKPTTERPESVAEGNRRIEPFHTMDLELGRGLDVGTSTICGAARKAGSGATVTNIQRNAFLDVKDDAFGRRLEK